MATDKKKPFVRAKGVSRNRKKAVDQQQAKPTKYRTELARQIKEIIEENALTPGFIIPDMAMRLGFKPKNFQVQVYHSLMKVYGMSFLDVLMTKRIEIAYKMLKEGKIRPQDILKAMGFFIGWLPHKRPDTRRAMLMEFGKWKENVDNRLASFGDKRLIMGENCKVPGELPEWYRKRKKS